MEYKYIQFPKRIKYAKQNPIVDFYKKCMKQAFDNSDVMGVQVWAFEINNKDYKKLQKLLKTHIQKTYPKLPYKRMEFEKNMILLDIGPKVSSEVEVGLVRINMEELYGSNKN